MIPEICNSWAALIPYTWFLSSQSKFPTELCLCPSVSSFLNFQFYIFVSDTKPSLVLVYTWAGSFPLLATINGVQFLWSDNLLRWWGSIIYWLYRDLFSFFWEITVSMFTTLFVFLLVFLYKNMERTAFWHTDECIFVSTFIMVKEE